ncbi:hypothetical protein [Paenibacillus macquariensis]|uniref:IDEAL domain-containing protein n=1 Tax=Paenibacillus macquariensis TaxID=948756 RepID=A0ABY1JUW6_9BACL|nr:hypothetical protein [Paenibacillus macquariensis]MEC0090878.1 hypothetical protein [Paenibacillus macquariensis]OAB34609.1 hypothetical protein PMSM_12190 [Paenibacillus macquariensis subsp. macquariensis]SIQ81564.1 hypothetical protein SAMN05421578_104184 [Paenibacillus macquariensis]
MYDYISIHSEHYTKKIKSKVLEEYLTSQLKFTTVSHLVFRKEVCGEFIRLTGIPANSNGNYAISTLEGVEEINLIEIDVPINMDDTLELVISDIANAIVKEFSWIIDADQGLDN